MSYMHIDNLSKNQRLLMFRECYAMEKIHGTSAHLMFNAEREPKLTYFSGGAKHDTFMALFDHKALTAKFVALDQMKVAVYGEAYGGSMQAMKDTYGPSLKFVAFDVKIEESWLSVPDAAALVEKLSLDFVDYVRTETTQALLEKFRDLPSRQAIRNGCGNDKVAEGIVVRPLHEFIDSRGNRVIAKFKRADFSERASAADTSLDPAKQKLLDDAESVAREWVTPMRFSHVIDKFMADTGRKPAMADTRLIINRMVEDVTREAGDEIIESKEVIKTIGSATAKLFMRWDKMPGVES